ncbi:ras guanine nucleotide exchange factor domain-containing protein, partial [Hysterangium stoloniferum]
QCRKLQIQSVTLLLTLRDNADKIVGTDYTKIIDEFEFAVERISRKANLWASWSTIKSLYSQSEIKQGLDDLKSDLALCATQFSITTQAGMLDKQREMAMLSESIHAEFRETLDRLLDSTNDIHALLNQPERNIQSRMLEIQDVLHADIAEPEMQHDLQQRLLNIHRRTDLLPPIIDLTGEVRRIKDHPVNISGGYSDVYLGEWLEDEKRFVKEVGIWRQLQHKNVARLYGVATIGDHIYTVSPWMKNLDALRYIENHPTADRLKILLEVATGLEFLHKHRVVHGDLRAANILISDTEVACITDFGLSVLLEEESSSTAGESHGNSRWMAPELINPELIGVSSVKPNVHTDVWSYGMLCLEIFTGERPFHNRIRIGAVITDLINGARPTRPPPEVTQRGLSDGLWGLMQQCWLQAPASRPAVTDIVRNMKGYQSNRSFSQPSLVASSCDTTLPHNRSASFTAGMRQAKGVTRAARPATAGAADPTFPRLDHIGETHREDVSSEYDDIIAYIRSGFGDSNPLPIVNIELPSSPSSLNTPYSNIGNRDSLSSVVTTSQSPGSHSDDRRTFSVRCDTGIIRKRSATMTAGDSVQQQELSNITYGQDGMVATGSLLCLIDRLITDFRKDTQYKEIFLATYQAFTNAEEVFKLLIKRFEALTVEPNSSEFIFSDDLFMVLIRRHRIVSVLELWLRGQRIQTKDIPLLRRMRTFASSIEQMVIAPTIITSAQRLGLLIDNKMAEFETAPLSSPVPSSPTSSVRTLSRPPDVSPSALADVLTKLESERFRKIIPSDFIGWLKKLRDNNGVSTFLTENHKLTYWVQKSILKPDLQHYRAENLKFFLRVTDECRKRHNFSSACALFLGIVSPTVNGLKRTMELDRECTRLFKLMEELTSSEGNFHNYRESLKSSTDSCIPWLRVHLHDIKTVHESRKTFLSGDGENDIVNFELYCDIYQQIEKLLSHNSKPIADLSRVSQMESSSSLDTHIFIENQLQSLVVNENLRNWLERRAARLTQEELRDYHNHTQELVAAGFLPRTR